MRLIRSLFVVLACLLSPWGSAVWAQIQPQVVERADGAMGRTLVELGGGFATGSGFVLSPLPDGRGYYYITNYHVIDGGHEIQVGFKRNNQIFFYAAKVLHTSRELDLAVLRIEPLDADGHEPGILVLREGKPLKGEQVAALGYPGSSDQINERRDKLAYFETTLTQGAISKVAPGSFNETGRTLEIVQHTASVNQGNSGGPLIDFCGSVLGINTVISVWSSDGRTPTNNTFWASSANPIAGFLRDAGVPFSAHKETCDPENPGSGPPQPSDGGIWVILAVLCGAGALVIGGMYYVASRSRGADAVRKSGGGAAVAKPQGRAILAASMGSVSVQFSAAQLQSGVTIGRAGENALTVTDRNLSRRHASLSLTDRKIMLTDLGSSNGTKVDGKRIEPNVPVQINTKSKVELGGIALVLSRP